MMCSDSVRGSGPDGPGGAAPMIHHTPRPGGLAPVPPFIPGVAATVLGQNGESRCRVVWNDLRSRWPSRTFEITGDGWLAAPYPSTLRFPPLTGSRHRSGHRILYDPQIRSPTHRLPRSG